MPHFITSHEHIGNEPLITGNPLHEVPIAEVLDITDLCDMDKVGPLEGQQARVTEVVARYAFDAPFLKVEIQQRKIPGTSKYLGRSSIIMMLDPKAYPDMKDNIHFRNAAEGMGADPDVLYGELVANTPTMEAIARSLPDED